MSATTPEMPDSDGGTLRPAPHSLILPRRTVRGLVALGCTLLVACATAPSAPPPQKNLFHDDLFSPSAADVRAEQIFAVSDAMRNYVWTEIQPQVRANGAQGGLIEALLRKGKLKLDYDSTVTRNAAEAFDARAGNCLSLVIMTAAFAKELGLQVRYQSAYREEAWSRSGTLLLRTGHVNVSLGPPIQHRSDPMARTFVIDFLPLEDASKVRTREISEETILAMYMNNRAVEALQRGRLDDAYAWARAAMRQSPEFPSAANTLGIVYARQGALDPAEAAPEED